LLIGLAGGLIAAWTMNQFQTLWTKASEQVSGKTDPPEQHEQDRVEAEAEDATMRAADGVSRSLFHRTLTKEEKKKAGPMVHYAFGSAMGALYGAAAEMFPDVTRGFGTGFGAALFAVADEIAVPAFGLSGKPTKAQFSSHLYGLASHLVYGATTEGVRRAAKAAF
jgi:uncharacterized membrane protein YagU involved in acid resistance